MYKLVQLTVAFVDIFADKWYNLKLKSKTVVEFVRVTHVKSYSSAHYRLLEEKELESNHLVIYKKWSKVFSRDETDVLTKPKLRDLSRLDKLQTANKKFT